MSPYLVMFIGSGVPSIVSKCVSSPRLEREGITHVSVRCVGVIGSSFFFFFFFLMFFPSTD